MALRIMIRLRLAERGARLLTKLPGLRKSAPRWIAGAATLDTEVHRFYDSHPGVYVEMFVLQIAARFCNLVALWVIAARDVGRNRALGIGLRHYA